MTLKYEKFDELDLNALNQKLERKTPEGRVETLLRISRTPALATSFGAQAALSLHLVTHIYPNIPVIFVDTEDPDAESQSYRKELCDRLRLNILPLRIAEGSDKVGTFNLGLQILGADAWISGLRREQSETRSKIPYVEVQDGRLKLHPFADWTSEGVRKYYEENRLPLHPIHGLNFNAEGAKRGIEVLSTAFGEVLLPKRECGLHYGPSALERKLLTDSLF